MAPLMLLLTGLAGLAALGSAGADAWRIGLLSAAWVVSTGACVAGWWRWPQGELRFDGAGWWWQPAHGPEQALPTPPAVALDLQGALMLHTRPRGGRAIWCWAGRTHDATRWDDLRRAVYCAAGEPEPEAAPPT